MRIRTKLLIGAVALLLLLVLQVAIVSMLVREIQNATTIISTAHQVIESNFRTQERVADLRRLAESLPSSRFVTARNSSAALDEGIDQLTSEIRAINRLTSELAVDSGLPKSISRKLDRVIKEHDNAKAVLGRAATLEELFERASLIDFSLVALRKDLDKLTVELRQRLQSAVDREREIHNQPLIAGITVGGAIVLLFGAFAWFFVDHNVAARLVALSDSMRAISGGNLRAAIPDAGNDDEIGRMTNALIVFRNTAVEVEEENLREIAEARQRLIDAIESINEGFALYDANDRLVLMNNRYQDLMYQGDADSVEPGQTFETIIRNAVARNLIPLEDEDEERWVQRRLEQHYNPDGSIVMRREGNRWVQVSERKIAGGGSVAVYTDITELKQREQEAEEANRTKSQFLANMSHELRTPMNAIIGFTRLVMRRSKDVLEKQQYDNLQKVLVSGEHLLSLINSVLDLSKVEAGQMELRPSSFALEPVLERCVRTVEPMVKSPNVQLEVAVDPDLPNLFNDEQKLCQVIINLLSNAAKFTDEGTIKIEAQQQAGQVHIAVTDTGAGIPEEAQETIFEEFKQADSSTTRSYGGTGLGLSISRRLARLMGGEITLKSAAGEGSTFTFILPIQFVGTTHTHAEVATSKVEEKATPVTAIKSQDGLPLNNERLILAIDDDPDVILLLRENLSELGYRVIGALNGDDGIRKAAKLDPSVITLDIKMSKMDGWQVLNRLKSDPKTRNIPVVLLTVIDNKSLGFQLGAAEYLSKPFVTEQLVEAIERVAPKFQLILVVDDDPDVEGLVRQLLEDQKCSIEYADGGSKAFELMKRVRPDAILLDLMMPHMDGFSFLQKLGDDPNLRDIPVIIITSKRLSSSEADFLKQRCKSIIEKTSLDSDVLQRELTRAIPTHSNTPE